MKKLNDWFLASLIAGMIGGACHCLFGFILNLIGIPTGTFWQAMSGLFYSKRLTPTWYAQIHGIVDAIGVSGANGILSYLVIKWTGKDRFYLKNAVMSAAAAYFLYLVVYPQAHFSKDNPYTPWVALFGHTVFIGLFTGYIMKKIYNFEESKAESKPEISPKPQLIAESLSSIIAEESELKKRKRAFVKPRKI